MIKNISHLRTAFAPALAGLLLAGCAATGPNPTASTGSVSAEERQVAQEGHVHKGFSKEAVQLAWGTPSQVTNHDTPGGAHQEIWTYIKTYHGHGGGYYGVPHGWTHGKRGSHYDPDTFYPAPHSAQTLSNTPGTDVPVKRATFEGNRVVLAEERKHQATRRASDE